MTVLFLMHDDYAAGGLQRSTMAAADCLMEAGCAVTIYCIKLVDGGLAEQFEHIRPLVLEARSRWGFWIRFLRALRREIACQKHDACIGMGLSASIILVLATVGMKRPRLIGSERAYPPLTPIAWYWKKLRPFGFRRLDQVVCQTRRSADWYEQSLGISRSRLVVIPNVVLPAPVSPPPPPNEIAPFAGHPLIVCVGRLEWQKGFDFALLIFVEIARRRPESRFLMIGEGPDEAQLKEQARLLGLGELLLLLPRLPSLLGLWHAVDLFLLTSRYEGIPNVLAEAMANGVASVAFDCPTGPSELIEDGCNGFLVPVGDIDAAAARCLRLLEDASFRRQIGDAARAISDRFSRETISAKWSALVEGHY